MFFGSQLSEGLFYLSLCLFNMDPEVGVSLIRKAHNVASAIFRIAPSSTKPSFPRQETIFEMCCFDRRSCLASPCWHSPSFP